MSERTTGKVARWVLMSAVLLTAGAAYGQEADKNSSATAQAQSQVSAEVAQDERNFQLTFTARELDENGKVVNSRRFDTTVTASSKGYAGSGDSNIRTGAKIPVAVSSGNGTYMEVGANFDARRARIVKGNRLSMQVLVDISSIDPSNATEGRPVIRQNRWAGDVEIPIGGKKVTFSSDDLSSKKTLQIELAVVPVEK